jgi:oligopeptide/dipeptide ABC transporter ATP-binding protein
MAILFITHDLGVIAQVADRVAVMYLGRIVESGPVREVLHSPSHPYTKGLLHALPKLDALDEPLTPIPGDIPSPLERPPGCVFHTRCPEVLADRCNSSVPQHTNVGQDHSASCFAVDSTGRAA